jgi:hypothetical protein
VPNIGNTSFTNLANLAILSYAGADPDNTTDPTVNIPTSVLPLNETGLHVSFPFMSIEVSRANDLRIQPLVSTPVVCQNCLLIFV